MASFRFALLLPMLLLLLLLFPGPLRADHDLAALRDRGLGVMRHGGAVPAPAGTPPPVPGCIPNAVLTDPGRAEMRRWGAALRDRGIGPVTILTSRQCSAWETALLLELGPVTPDAELDPPSATDLAGRGERLRQRLVAVSEARVPGSTATLFITHRALIAAMTGIEAAHGEALVLGADHGALALLGRLSVE